MVSTCQAIRLRWLKQILVDDRISLPVSCQHARPALPPEDAHAATTLSLRIRLDAADQRQPALHVRPRTCRDDADLAGICLLKARGCSRLDRRTIPGNPKQRGANEDVTLDCRERRQACLGSRPPEQRRRHRPDRTHLLRIDADEFYAAGAVSARHFRTGRESAAASAKAVTAHRGNTYSPPCRDLKEARVRPISIVWIF